MQQTPVAEPTTTRRHLWHRALTRWLTVPLQLLVDALSVYAAHRLAYLLRVATLDAGEPIPPAAPYDDLAFYSSVGALGVFAAMGLYGERSGLSRWRETLQVIAASGLVGMLDLALIFFVRSLGETGFTFSRLAWFLMIGLLIGLMGTGRTAIRGWQAALRRRGWGVRRTVIVGSDALARLVAQRQISEPGLGYRLVGFVADTAGADLPAPLLGQTADLPGIVHRQDVDEVILAVPDLPRQTMLAIVAACTAARDVRVQFVPDILEFMTTKIRVSDLAGLPLVSLQTIPLQRWHNRTLKRAFDLTVAALGLVVTAPLLGIIAVGVYRSSPGPVFFRQERVSRDGQRFGILKFRTMRVDAEQGTGPVWASQDDDRRTPFGAWLRRTSLDELPQLINVLKGEMSIVGPRPERPHFTGQFETQISRYVDRHLVKAGITGWAQVNGLRGDVPVADRTSYDLYYVENWSLWLDVQIIIQSVRCVIGDYRSGRAY